MNSLKYISRKTGFDYLLRFYKFAIIDSVIIIKKHGFKALMQQRGKKLLFTVVGYYLIRDTILYIIIPYCIAINIF